MRRAAEALNLDVGPPDSNVVPMDWVKQAAP
jgi:hypothetical protein